jgi:hypothetical protein
MEKRYAVKEWVGSGDEKRLITHQSGFAAYAEAQACVTMLEENGNPRCFPQQEE